MSVKSTPFSVIFPPWFDEIAALEHQSKGWLADVEVRLEDGTRYRLHFYDPVRLAQDLEAYTKLGKPYLAEPNMVVVPEVCPPAINAAVAGLCADGVFAHFQPFLSSSGNHSSVED
jgi:hypothetical protein